MLKCTGKSMWAGIDISSVLGGGGCGLREPSSYSSLIDFKLCDFIRYPSLSLAQNPLKWRPTAFIVKAEIFSKPQECLHEPPSSFPSDSILTPSALAVLSWCCFKLTNMLLPQDLCTGGAFFRNTFSPDICMTCSFTFSRSLWKCHFVRWALSESSLSYPNTTRYFRGITLGDFSY